MLGFYSTSDDEDEQVTNNDEHTASSPYCSNLSCWCHTNVEYHSSVTDLSGTVDGADYQAALRFYGISA
jgi:hypothetical protein